MIPQEQVPLLRRFGAAVRFIMKLEPVAVQAIIRAVFVLAGTVGLAIGDDVQAQVLAAVVALYALVETVTTVIARARSTPTVRVVEVATPDGDVVAGPANEAPDGTYVRAVGSLLRQ